MRAMSYALVGGIAVRHQFQYMGNIIFKNIFLVIVLFIFASIWRVVFANQAIIAGFTMVQTLWYLSFTEIPEMGKSRMMTPIQEEIKSGSIAYTLIRPYNYVLFYLSRGLGESLVNALPMLIIGFGVSTLMVGLLPGYFSAILPGLVLIAGGLMLNLLLQIIIGLLAFWMEESTPVYWIIQKAVFILGGLFFPIDFFPPWLAGISKALPFAYITYWPARVIVDFDFQIWFKVLGGQLMYGLLFFAAASFLFRSGMKRLESNGG